MSKAAAKRKSPGNPAALDEVGEDAILERIASGERMGDIAASYNLSRPTLYRWLEATPERRARLDDARRQQAHALVEEASEILDNANPETAAEASIIRARADHRRWVASKLYRDLFGETPGVNLNLNVGQLHLDALRQFGSMATAPGALGPVVDAELVEEGAE